MRAYLAAHEHEHGDGRAEEEEGGRKATLIVGITGYESETHRPIALAAGQDRVLGKPYDEDAIRATLAVLVSP